MAASNQDLKHFSKSDLLGFAGAVFMDFCPRRETYARVYSQNEIYDIGTEILLLTKNDHNSKQKAPKSTIPEEIKSAGHSPSSGSVKTRFKALLKK